MRRQSGAGTIAALALTCVFGATMLLSLATGAMVYRRVADRVELSSEDRVGLTYITAKIHSYDASGCVEVGQFDGLDALYLYTDVDGSGYVTILYVYDGWLRELYCERDLEFDPADGETISAAESLLISEPLERCLSLEFTGARGVTESTVIYLRSEG